MHFRHYMFYEFHLEKEAPDATKSICNSYGNDAISLRTCKLWFYQFQKGDFDIYEKLRSIRPVKADEEFLKALIEEDPKRSTRNMALEIGVAQKTVCNRLHALGKVQKQGKWIPHQLTETNMASRFRSFYSLLSRQKKMSFFWKIVTGNETWIYYDNPVNKKQCGRPRPATVSYTKTWKIWEKGGDLWMLGSEGYNLLWLPRNQWTVTTDIYSQPLRCLSRSLDHSMVKEGEKWYCCMITQNHMLRKRHKIK